jgi:SAM-dependent methyltransferase
MTNVGPRIYVSVASSIAILLGSHSVLGQQRMPTLQVAPQIDTPLAVVEDLIDLASVRANDVVFDLGCGDGRIAIAAARRGATARGFDIDETQLKRASHNLSNESSDIQRRVTFTQSDALAVDLSPATVIVVSLLADMHNKIARAIESRSRRTTRVAAIQFRMGRWTPTAIHRVRSSDENPYTIYFYDQRSTEGGRQEHFQ